MDGAMGTMIQRLKLEEADFRGTSVLPSLGKRPLDLYPHSDSLAPTISLTTGQEFLNWKKDLKGNNDLLVITLPDAIYDIHYQYLEAGADFVETNTFSGTRIAQADYDTQEYAYKINKAAAEIAKRACQDVCVFLFFFFSLFSVVSRACGKFGKIMLKHMCSSPQ